MSAERADEPRRRPLGLLLRPPASEIGGLSVRDVVLGVGRPHLVVRAEFAKGGRPRRVPLWWDSGTLADLAAWKRHCEDHGARAGDPFVCSLQRATYGGELN